MNRNPLSLKDAFYVELKVFHDSRGFFTERFKRDFWRQLLPEVDFIQDNHSRSFPGVLRGLHFQRHSAQGKLVSVSRGKILDVIVDLRTSSPSFGQWESVELSDENARMLWVPPGFAHGFCVTGSESADVHYKVDQPYSPGNEGGIIWNDSTIGIRWPIASPTLSDKDSKLGSFADYRKDPWFK